MSRQVNLKCYLVPLILILGVFTPANAKIIYVDDDATGANDGSSWVNAYNFLQDALADANASEKPVEIRAVQGIYKPDHGRNQTLADRKATFQLINGVTLKGGYAGFGQPDPNARDVGQYETVLSGNLNGDDGLDFLNKGENSYHVVSGSGTESNAVMDGFTITGGNADGPLIGEYPFYDHTRACGGGMYNEAGHPTVCNCRFSGNAASWGAGMRNSYSDPTLISCIFSANRATGRRYPYPMLWDVPGRGGGMENFYSSPTLTNCTFTGNRCWRSDAVLSHAEGGGMYNSRSNPALAHCAFSKNSSDGHGGAMSNTHSSPRLMDCTFSHNLAPWGGAVSNAYSSPTLVGCAFSANSASWRHCRYLIGPNLISRGGAMENQHSGPTLTNCIFTGNRCSDTLSLPLPFPFNQDRHTHDNVGDGEPIVVTAPVSSGGAIHNGTGCSLALTNCIFTGNSALNGEAVACSFLWVVREPSSVELTNCILWDAENEIWNNDGSTITTVHSNVQGGKTAIVDPCNAVIWSKGNIDVDPCFAEPGYWDPNGTPEDPNDDFWIDGDYHLKSQAGRWDPVSESWVQDDVTSPCIDAGNPTGPVGEEPFPNGGIINMGAYGGTAEASKSYFGQPVCETIVAGDINGDCKVDAADFAIMAYHWLEER